jgi:hypothetical protein
MKVCKLPTDGVRQLSHRHGDTLDLDICGIGKKQGRTNNDNQVCAICSFCFWIKEG